MCTETDTSNVRFVQNDEIQLVLKLFCCVCVLLLIYCLLLTCHETRGFNTLPSLYSSFNEWGKKKTFGDWRKHAKIYTANMNGLCTQKIETVVAQFIRRLMFTISAWHEKECSISVFQCRCILQTMILMSSKFLTFL